MQARRPSERAHHARLGWWIMFHRRGGAAVIGVLAAGVLGGDLAYVVLRWNGLRSGFDGGVLVGVGCLSVFAALVRALGAARPLGADRDAARRRATASTWLTFGGIAITLACAYALGRGGPFGAVVGEIAALAAGFAAFSAWWTLRPTRRHSTH